MYSERQPQHERAVDTQKVYRLEVGQEIKDTTNRAYKLDRLLGKGGMGMVFEATNLENGMRVAIKFIHPECREEPSLVQRFEREILTVAQVPSPFILFPIDRIEVQTVSGETVGFVTELVKGNNLLTEVSQSTFEGRPYRMDPLLVCEYASEIALAIAAMDKAGFVHRDLKLNNIFLQDMPDGTKIARVGDFGVAGTSVDWDEDETMQELWGIEKEGHLKAHEPLTHPNLAIGSPHISSPELFRKPYVTSKSDIFALGVMCYTLLTGQEPFDGVDRQTVREQILYTNPLSFEEQHASFVPEVFQQLVMDMLSKDPGKRPSGKEVYARLKAWIASAHPEKLKQIPFIYQFKEPSDVLEEKLPLTKAA